MKKTVVIFMATVCLLGCKQEKKELHDPLLRQQLTTMVSSLSDENTSTVTKSMNDITAILSVNSAKMSEDQSNKLSSAREKLENLYLDYSDRDLKNALHPENEDKNQPSGISDKISDVKKTISEAAATF